MPDDMDQLDEHGLYPDTGLMTTASGRRVNPLTMTAGQVAIEDIAVALCNQCRYNGHVGGFLSVARHSLWVSNYLWYRDHTAEVALAGLLHDAAEAYLGDMIRPLKHGELGVGYLAVEARLEAVIFEAFDLPYPLSPAVSEADNFVLMNLELPEDGARWNYSGDPRTDHEDFLLRFLQLTSMHRQETQL